MITSFEAVVNVLGVASEDLAPLHFAARIEAGLPVAALDRLAHAIAPNDEALKYRIVPRPTLARRRKDALRRLSPEESGRLTRLAGVWTFATKVWGGENEARGFMFTPHAMLGGRKPIDLALGSEIGADLVENVLGGLHYGFAA